MKSILLILFLIAPLNRDKIIRVVNLTGESLKVVLWKDSKVYKEMNMPPGYFTEVELGYGVLIQIYPPCQPKFLTSSSPFKWQSDHFEAMIRPENVCWLCAGERFEITKIQCNGS